MIRLSHLGLVLLISTSLVGCIVHGDGPQADELEVGCWAIGVTNFSSSGLPGQNDFGATQATGTPDTQDWNNPSCIDSPQAWSPEFENGGFEYIDLIYAVPLRVDRLRIFENFGPGASEQATLINTESPNTPVAEIYVPSGLQGPGQPCSVLALDIDSENGGEFTFDSYDKVAMDLDTTLSPGYNEIDAIQMVGLLDLDRYSLPPIRSFPLFTLNIQPTNWCRVP